MDFLKTNVMKIFIAILGIGALLVIIISIITSNRTGGNYEDKLLKAAKNYYADNKVLLPKENYESASVTSNTLISGSYLEPATDENGNVITCSSYVNVVKMDSEYVYSPIVKCNFTEDTILGYEKLINSTVATTDGLYQINNEYIYKGENPNNYVSFAKLLWRVIKIDKNNNIKLIYAGSNAENGSWDDRFNIDTNENSGINNFEVSRVSDFLNDFLNDDEVFSNSDRAKLTMTDLCVGKRALKDNSTDGSTECLTLLKNKLISLIQVNEYLSASGDSNCPVVSKMACQNYNYLADANLWTINGSSSDTSKVMKVSSSYGLKEDFAAMNGRILPVIYLNSSNVITEGEGTETNPYILR